MYTYIYTLVRKSKIISRANIHIQGLYSAGHFSLELRRWSLAQRRHEGKKPPFILRARGERARPYALGYKRSECVLISLIDASGNSASTKTDWWLFRC